MHLTGDPPFNNKGRRAWLATFISKSVLAAPMPEPTPENLVKAGNDIQQTRSRISSTREEPSHQASLMAGNLIPGPSDVPCLVESSTAHGVLLFWITVPSIGVLNLSEFSSDVSNLVQNSQIPPLPSPKLPDAPQNLPANPCGRHTQIYLLSITPTSVLSPLSRHPTTSIHIRKGKLGFRNLVGCFIYVGPSPKLWPILKIIGLTIRFTKPRSALSFTMLSPIPLFSRFSSLCGRRLHRCWTSESMLWPCIQHPYLGIVKYPFLFQPSRTMVNCSRKNFGILFRTPLLPVTEKNRTRSSSASQCFKPAIRKAKDPFSTSQDHLIVTISKIPETFVEVSSTHHVLACGMLLVSLCFRVYMNLSFKLFNYPIFFMYVVRICSKYLYLFASPLG